MRVSWTARRSSQSILKEISPECSLEGLMLKLKLQYFGHLMQRTDSLEKTLMLGGKLPWRRKWQLTPVSLPGKCHGQRNLVGCSPLGHKELGTTEQPTLTYFSSVQSLSRVYPMNRSTPGLPVHHQLAEFTQTHIHRVRDAIQPSHPLSSPSPPVPNPSQHQSLFQRVNSSHQVAKVLEFQL